MPQKRDALISCLLESIQREIFKPGEKIPSRNYLAQQYHISYDTVDKALKLLIANGTLTAVKGKGTFISSSSGSSCGISRLYAVYHSHGYFNQNLEMVFSEDRGTTVPIYKIRDHAVELYLPRFLRPGSGVVWYYPFPQRINIIRMLQLAHIPTLLLNRDYDGFNCVMTDAKASLREGIAWLHEFAGSSMALIYGQAGTAVPYLSSRIIAAYEICAEMQIPLTGQNIFRAPTNHYLLETPEIAARLFQSEQMPRGIILLDHEMALLLVYQGLHYGKIPGRDYYLLMFDTEPELMEYQGIGMMNQMLQSFCDEAEHFFFDSRDEQTLFRKYIKTELWYKKQP